MKTALILLSILGMACAFSVSSLWGKKTIFWQLHFNVNRACTNKMFFWIDEEFPPKSQS